MKNKHHNTDKGKFSEDIAFQFLLKAGYEILDLNWSIGRYEIDIICRQKNYLIFIEVKSRVNSALGNPSVAVSREKRKRIIQAAYAYMERINYDGNFRFDIITILGYQKESLSLEHFQDCFFPGL